MKAPVTRMRRMPDEVRRLRAPWPSLAREIPNLTPELEREFRFGQRVALTERGFLFGGTIKGGSSSMWIPTSVDQYEAYLRWRIVDGFPEDGDPGDFQDLEALVRVFGIDLVSGRGHNPDQDSRHRYRRELGGVYAVLLRILRELPPAHLEREELSRIQIGGWGPDAAKGSAYQDGTVYLYDFAVRGARRTLIGLFLHELGHAHEHAVAPSVRAQFRRHYETIVRHDAVVGIEYLLDTESRRAYQKIAFEEFLAETHLAYTACGAALRDHVESLPAEPREAWRAAYALFRESFDGFEYE